MKQRISMGSTGQAIVVTNMKFNEDGFVSDSRAALVPFDPSMDQGEILEKAGKWEWEIYGMKNLQGFYAARQKRLLTTEELDKQQFTGSGRTIINEVVEAEAATAQVASQRSEPNTGSRLNTQSVLNN